MQIEDPSVDCFDQFRLPEGSAPQDGPDSSPALFKESFQDLVRVARYHPEIVEHTEEPINAESPLAGSLGKTGPVKDILKF